MNRLKSTPILWSLLLTLYIGVMLAAYTHKQSVPKEPYPWAGTGLGIWISGEELASRPTSGTAWNQLKAVADQNAGKPNISDKNQMNDVFVLAKALVWARTGENRYREEVIDNIIAAIGTEAGGKTLALGRNLAAYVIAADLINLAADPEQDKVFRAWLRDTLTETLDGRTLQSTHEVRPNNWGTFAGASRAAVAVYLGDTAELERSAQVFKGWLGDRNAYAGFRYRSDLSWQADQENPVGIVPPGAVKQGYSIDGALPEEMRRGGEFQWPPQETGYPWGALQGALVLAEILHRAGYPAWEWGDRALLRAAQFLYDIDWEPEGDDEWQPWLINHAYSTAFPATTPARPGKNMGWTDWTHSEHHQKAREKLDELTN
ncbi:MAG: alginate lyase family protein [Anaerolineae bacterium]